MKWIGQNIWDQISKFRNTVDFSEDVTFYQPVNNANPNISIGSSDDERLRILVNYQGTTTQSAQLATFITHTESGTADDGRFVFAVDEVSILDIDDDGIDFRAGKGIAINGTDILTDNGSGAATLSNIDALDATTIATFNAALTAGDITGVTAGTGLSGGGTTGAVTLNVDASIPEITTLAGLTSFGAAGATTNIVAGDITVYNPVNDGSPTISLGSAAENALKITSAYNSGGISLENVTFDTSTSSGAADDGRLIFKVDNTQIVGILDDGVYLSPSMKLYCGTIPIIDDDSGETTLKNIDALDATTIATFETAMEANLDTLNLEYLFIDGNLSGVPGKVKGAQLHVDTITFTDTGTSEGGTSSSFADVAIEAPTIAAPHPATITEATTLYISGAPIAGTNQTITNPYALWVDDGLVKFDGALTVGGAITGDVTGALTGQADTVATIAGLAPNTATTQASQPNITGVGTIGTGVWQGTAVASTYLDADTMHYSAQRQLTHHMIKDDIGTGVIYIGLQEADAENAGISNKNLPLLAPVAGKLLKIFVRTTIDMSGVELTWRLYTRAASASTGGSASVIGTANAVAGPTDSSMVTYDFTSVSSNAINAGDKVQISVQANGSSADATFLITCLWEWDLS